MIPELVNIGSVWRVVKFGIYDTTLDEIKNRFATNDRRKQLYEGLLRGCLALKIAGCKLIYLDGSYITSKPLPNDFDVCWDPIGVDPDKLDSVFLDFSDNRRIQKQKFYGEFFPSSALADGYRTFVEFFQVDKHTGNKKGILRVQLK
jgi:hypothetical protein